LVNSTGGTVSVTDTVVDQPAAYNEATLAAQMATVVNKINQVISVLKHLPK
jgi:hypothetical protein